MEYKSAELFALQCPKCGASVQYKRESDTYSCGYCGISFKLLMNQPGGKDHSRAIEAARRSYEQFRFKDARKNYLEAYERAPDDWEAEIGIAACDVMLSTWRQYGGPSFEAARESLVARFPEMPEEERKEAKLKLAYHLTDASAYCFMKLWTQVFDAWEKYDDFSMRMFDEDVDLTSSGDIEMPDIKYWEVELDYERWMQEAVDLVFDAIPEGERLGPKELEIVDYYISYTTIWRKDKESVKNSWKQAQIGACKDKLKNRNPESDGLLRKSRFHHYVNW